MTEDNELIEVLARAVFYAEDPHTGDQIGATIHSADEHAYGDGEIEQQLENVMATCRSAARAFLTAYRNHQVVL